MTQLEQKGVVFITETCCVVSGKGLLVNNGSTQCKVSALTWLLVNRLISVPGRICSFPELYEAVWNTEREVADVQRTLRRLKEYCKRIGVDDKDLNRAFEFIPNEGIRFNPPDKHIDYIVPLPVEEPVPVDSAQVQQGAYYITDTCYFLRKKQVLVNNGKTSKTMAGIVWDFLNHFLHHPGVLIPYDDISMAVWGDKFHNGDHISQLTIRLKREYLYPIGVNDEDLNLILVTTSKQGITFHPKKPINLDLEDIGEALRDTGIPQDQLLRMIDCMLYRGISGRMGREAIVALAKKNNMLAALELGELYYHGYVSRNHKPDYKTACEYYEKAGQHPTALWTLGYCIMNNYWPVVDKDQIDYLKARDYFVQAINITTKTSKSAAAYTSLGQLWEEGHYPEDDFAVTHRCQPRDMKQAMYYYKLADNLGYHYATNRLALRQEKYALSLPGNKDEEKKAFELFERSISLVVDGYALNKLGQYYEKGFGCEVNPDKACECYIRGVDEVLEDDITGWNLFNAGRVCANRIRNQPQWYCDLPRAFDLFNDALLKLPAKDHGKVLVEMMEILSFGDTSALDPIMVERKKHEVQYRVRRYLEEVEKSKDSRDREMAERVRVLSGNL